MSVKPDVCEYCGAVNHGNLRCPACRDQIRKECPQLKDLMDRLDTAKGWTFALPLGPEDLRGFLEKLNG